jgi:hypothetical protein
MKFLCVPCDQPMKLTTVRPPDRGSLSVVYSCAACGYEMAMLTNPYETQVVSSLGVTIAPEAAAAAMEGAGAAAPTAGTAAAHAPATGPGAAEGAKEGGGKCPFADMIPGLMGQGTGTAATTTETAGDVAGGGVASGGAVGAAAALGYAAGVGAAAGGAAPVWTDTASARLEVIPSFVRPMARTGIERFARERGYATIDEKVLEEARAFFGM